MTSTPPMRRTLLLALLLGTLVIGGAACGRAATPTATPLHTGIPTTKSSPTAVAVPALADLVVTIRGPDSAEPGQALGDRVSIEVTNRGNATARNFSVGLYFSTDRSVDQRDTLLLGGREFIKSLDPGETTAVSLSGSNTLPDGLPEGTGYLGVIVDETDAVQELDEDNNTALWRIAIRVPTTATPSPSRTSTATTTASPSPTPTSVGTHTATATRAASPSPTAAKPTRTPTSTTTVSPSPLPTLIVVRTPTKVVIKTATPILLTPEAYPVALPVPLPGRQATGLAWDWDNGWLWVSDVVAKQIYAVDPQSGKVQSSFAAEASSPWGLAWDGEALWIADHAGKWLLYQVVPAKGGFTLNVLRAPGKNSAPCGLAYGDKSLWVSHGCAKGDDMDTIYQIDPWDGTVLNAFPSPGKEPGGLAFSDGVLWNVDGATEEIYGIDPYTGDVLRRGTVSGVRAIGPLFGLAFNGRYLWVNDAENLYQLKP